MSKTIQAKISGIRIGNRFRSDLGDIAALAKSIDTLGLLHPVLIAEDGALVCGQRRIVACKELGWTMIDARIVDIDALQAEHDENEMRKAFSISERVAIARAIEDREKAAAKDRQKASGGDRKSKAAKNGSVKLTEPIKASKPATPSRDVAASSVGMAPATYTKAKAVVEAAEKEPEKYGDLAERMDKTNRVDGAFKEMERRRQPPPAPKPEPKHPHSERVERWLRVVTGELAMIHDEHGSLEKMAADKKGWEPGTTKRFIIPMLESLEDTFRTFRKEIEKQ